MKLGTNTTMKPLRLTAINLVRLKSTLSNYTTLITKGRYPIVSAKKYVDKNKFYICMIDILYG